MIGLGVDELRWHLPVRPGDTLKLEVEIEEKVETSSPKRGRITFSHTLYNQNGEAVMTYKSLNLIYRKEG